MDKENERMFQLWYILLNRLSHDRPELMTDIMLTLRAMSEGASGDDEKTWWQWVESRMLVAAPDRLRDRVFRDFAARGLTPPRPVGARKMQPRKDRKR